MKHVWTITKKEFASFFNSSAAYIVISVFLLFTGWFFFQQFFLLGETTLRPLFSLMPIMYIFFAPALTMRLISEERKSGTLELLVTLPINNWAIILGKFFAALGILTIASLATLAYAVTVAFLGDLDWGPVIGGYFALLLLGGGYIALGLFSSAVTRNQITSFIIGFALCFLMFVLDKILIFLPSFMASTVQYLSIDYHFHNIARGVIDSRDLIYYGTFIGMFLLLSVHSLENEKLR